MKDVLEQALADVIVKATTGAEEAGSFIMSEVPEVVQQLLMFKAVSTGVQLFLCALFVTIWFRFVTKKYKEGCRVRDCFNATRNEGGKANCLWADRNTHENFYGVLALSGIPAGVVALCTVSLSMTLLKLTLAPKVWLIEYAAKLLGS
jgi:hypothetical protein